MTQRGNREIDRKILKRDPDRILNDERKYAVMKYELRAAAVERDILLPEYRKNHLFVTALVAGRQK